MTNKKKLQAIYSKALKTGRLEHAGLCYVLLNAKISDKNLMLFEPNIHDETVLSIKGKSLAFWGSDLSCWDDDKLNSFTPLRQTILGFLIAMEK